MWQISRPQNSPIDTQNGPRNIFEKIIPPKIVSKNMPPKMGDYSEH